VLFFLAEGKGSVEQVQERVTRIQQLRESLDDEMKKSGSASVEKMDSSQPVHNRVKHQINISI
jgi:hypothetical protein